VIGIGNDLVDIDRFRRALERTPTLRERVFTDAERQYADARADPTERYAVRFAAKEAVMKALGRGWGAKVRWLDIEVVRARSGKPDIALHDKTARLAAELGIRRWVLSITHTKEHGLAFVIAQDE
jgi:holo-[acyl-carrier protein] synthase